MSKTTDLNWQLWCRLCAKDDPNGNVKIVFKDDDEERERRSISQYLYKYFGIEMDEALPKMLCTDCFSFVTSLVNFADRVDKVQQMFQALLRDSDCTNADLHSVRLQFGILENDREHIFIPQTSLLEVHYFDSKPKYDKFEEKIFEEEVDAMFNPLEQQNVKPEDRSNKSSLTADHIEEKKARNSKIDSKNFSDEDENFETHSEKSLTTAESEVSATYEQSSPLNSNNMELENSDESSCKNGRRISSLQKYKQKDKDDVENPCLVSHKKRSKKRGADFTCSECSRVFTRVQHFRQHMKRIHSISPPFSDWKCSFCPDRVFSTQYQLDKHLKVHLPPELKRTVPCPYCEKKFSTNGILQTHIKYIHNNDRSFICEECGLTMRTNAALKAHMLTHTDYAPFECPVCNKGFKNNIRLKNHMETHDPHKHICAECGLQLNSRATLNRHLLVHSDVMLHKCDYCGRAFKRAKALKNHLILHTGLKPYSCDFCDRTFANGSNCRSHKKKAHPEELAALEASGGGKQYTRNIPKLEALKAVTKAADNLAPVVSKQSGCFAFGKKPKPSLQDADKTSAQAKNTSDAPQPTTANLNTDPKTENLQANKASIPKLKNIYNHFLKQANDTGKQDHTLSQTLLTEDMDISLSSVALHLQQQEIIMQSEQSLSQPQTSLKSVSNAATVSPNHCTTINNQIPKLSELPLLPMETNLRHQQQLKLHQNTSIAFHSRHETETQQSRDLLGSVRSPESQSSHLSDEHSNSTTIQFCNHKRQDLPQGNFI